MPSLTTSIYTDNKCCSSSLLLKMIWQLGIGLILQLVFLMNCNAQSVKVYEGNALEWLQWNEIAIPTGTKNFTITAPNKPPNKTEIDIEMFNVEIIQFDVRMQQFTIKMDLEINWPEKRLKLINSSLVNGWMKAPLAWSPQIDIRSGLVSESRKSELIEVKTDSEPEVSYWHYDETFKFFFEQSSLAKMTFSLTTTINCNMDFEMSPTDNHTCKLEVS